MTEEIIYRRGIRSFVRRQGRMSDNRKEAMNGLFSVWGIPLTDKPLNFPELLGSSAPCVLEIGFGMGDSLLTMAEQAPDIHFIGVEVHKPGVANILHEINVRKLQNIRVIEGDALLVLKQMIPAKSLSRLQLFFPDPWPKKRHQKRRIVQPEFLNLVHACLASDGLFHAATDWEDYAHEMADTLNTHPGFVSTVAPESFSPRPIHRPLTKFENRGFKLGHQSWDLIYQKRDK